jgi:hypothetical protein
MSKPVVIHNARFGKFPVTCECGNMITLSLVKGCNKRSTVCARCKGTIRVIAVYDGYGVATLKKLSVEQLEMSDGNEF